MAEAKERLFSFSFNLGHLLIVLGMLGSGLTVYVGVFQTMTSLVLRVDTIEKNSALVGETHELAISNKATIDQLKEITASIKDSNTKMLEQLTSIRIDIGILKAQSQIKTSAEPLQ